jgi:hypothetical protein
VEKDVTAEQIALRRGLTASPHLNHVNAGHHLEEAPITPP